MAKRQSEIQTKYDSTHCKRYSIKLHIINDEEIIAKLDSVPSVNGYIRQLIKQDLEIKKAVKNVISGNGKGIKINDVELPDLPYPSAPKTRKEND